ncbi:MAG: hypothetical protein LBI53_06215 [Candidatus Peribacteria bacterium]|jgi:hypothetical protein|nr:hypothetical protein [Candidatus Peribacteria bacterium]
MQDTKFYDATNLVQAEKQGTEEMTAIYTYDVFGEKNQTNLVCLRAIRGNDKSKWKSKTIATLVEDQKKQYGL